MTASATAIRSSMHLSGRNFQAWAQFDLPISDFTVVVGKSDIGKSALMRAIRGVLRNEISASKIKKGCKDATVNLVIDDLDISARRTNASTTYTINGEEYKKLGRDIPSVMKGRGFEPVALGRITLDPVFAGQFDQQFLITAGSSELNTVLGAFSCTEKLDQGKKRVRERIKQIESDTNLLAEQHRGHAAVVSSLERDCLKAVEHVNDASVVVAQMQQYWGSCNVADEVITLNAKGSFVRSLLAKSVVVFDGESAQRCINVVKVIDELHEIVDASQGIRAKLSVAVPVYDANLPTSLQLVRLCSALTASATQAQSFRAQLSHVRELQPLDGLIQECTSLRQLTQAIDSIAASLRFTSENRAKVQASLDVVRGEELVSEASKQLHGVKTIDEVVNLALSKPVVVDVQLPATGAIARSLHELGALNEAAVTIALAVSETSKAHEQLKSLDESLIPLLSQKASLEKELAEAVSDGVVCPNCKTFFIPSATTKGHHHG